jgi:hypothetical protein
VKIRFYIDPETGRPHVENHGVSTSECAQVLESPLQDFAGRDDSRVALGQTRGGGYLKVIYTRGDDGSLFVITAYPLVGKPLAALKRRLRKKGR